MIFQCDDLERALQSAELMRDARAHAETCERCHQQLYLWNEISRLAPQLHQEWESPSLWPAIQLGLTAAAPHRKPPVWRWILAAAAVIAMAVVLVRPWIMPRSEPHDFLTDDALREVQQTEAAYARSIDRLSSVAGSSLQLSPAPLAAAYREKIVLLDSAIAELRANVEQNRYNVFLQTQLAGLYREKQKTLQEWLENAKQN